MLFRSIVYFKYDSDFSEVEFGDFKNLLNDLKARGDRFPLWRKFSPEVQTYLVQWRGEKISPKIASVIVRDLNGMLFDPLLFREMMDYYERYEREYSMVLLHKFLKPPDIRLGLWLAARLDAHRVFEGVTIASEEDWKMLHRLNRIILNGVFNTDRLYEIFAIRSTVYTEPERVIEALETAGFRFSERYDILTAHYILEFVRG